MKKYLVKIMFLGFVVTAMGYNAYSTQKEIGLSDLALNNIEALAKSETGACPFGCVSGFGGCYCNGYYPQFSDYTGW